MTTCCGVPDVSDHARQGDYGGGAYETECDECSEPVCSSCAAWFDQDGGYGEDGQGFRTHATCRDCADCSERGTL